jgi:flagellar hook-basal body complex protein FliE
MDLMNISQATGNKIDLLRTDARQFDTNGVMGALGGDTKATFSDAMASAMEGVNASQIKATDLYQKMVTDPNSVDVHDVTLAAAEASMSLNLAKTVVERAVQAYRDIINMR